MNDTALSESVKANTGRITAEYRARRVDSLIEMLREPRHNAFKLFHGETAVGHQWANRPEDNALVLLFGRPCEHGRDYWMVEEERVRGDKIFHLYFLFSGPMLLIDRTGRAVEYAPPELAKLYQEIRRILAPDSPLLR